MEYLSSIITSMDASNSYGSATGFGAWLEWQLRSRNWSQKDFAERVGVSQGTVSRWILGRRPAGRYIDLIADALVLDYDTVATQAGYRPRELLEIDPSSATARLMPLIEAVNWDAYASRLESLEAELRWMIERDRERG